MATLTEWQHKLAKDDKAVLVQYINETKETLHLDFFDVENGKPIEPKKVPKELKPGSNVTLALRIASHKKEKKQTKVIIRWLGEATFLLTLFVWKDESGGFTGKASHSLDATYQVKKKASWKQKPPLVTVRIFIPDGAEPKKSEKTDGSHPTQEGKEIKAAKEVKEKKKEKKEVRRKEKSKKDKEPEHQRVPSQSPGAEQVHAHAGNLVAQGIQQLEAGKFEEAQASFVQSVACLVNFSAQSYHVFQAEMTFAASQFLSELKRLHSQQLYKQMALISSFLADLPLQVEHSIINARIGININFQVGNFGTAAHLIQIIARLVTGTGCTLPEQSLLEEMLEYCSSQELKDNCVPLGGKLDRVLCLGVLSLLLKDLLFQTMRLVRGSTYNFCPYCQATFRPHLMTVCSYCNTILQEGTTSK